MTYRYAAFSLLEKFKQLGDDSKISLDLAVFYIQIAANNLKYQHLKKQDVANMTGAYLSLFDNISVSKNANDSTFTLPESIYDLKGDGGIEFVAYQMDKACDYLTVIFSRTTAGKVWNLSNNLFMKPSPDNPVMWREGNKVHLSGISCIDVDNIIAGIYTTVSTSEQCNLDEEIDIDPQYDQLVLIQAEGLMRFGYAVTQERMNDGTDMIERINKVEQQLEIPLASQTQNEEDGSR